MNKKEIVQHIKKLAESEKNQVDKSLTTRREKILNETVKILKENFDYYSWVGIYLLKGDELILGPYLGKPSPHTRIPLNQGICGAAVSQRKSIIVPDVNADPRYLACSLETKSEIVVPIMKGNKVLGEIDIDSDRLDAFSQEDQTLLEQVCSLLSELL